MLSDKKFSLDFYRFLFDASGTVVTTGPQTSAGGELKCYHVDPTTGTFEPWAVLTGNLFDTGGVVTREFSLDSPFFGWSPADVVLAGSGAMTVNLDVLDLVLRCRQSTTTGYLEWLLTWSGIEWWVNGVLRSSIGGGTLNGFALSESQIPIIGGFVEMAAGAATVPLAPSVGDECPDLTGFNSERSGLAVVQGGYCYQEAGGDFVEPPVTLNVKPMVAAGSCGVDYQPTVSGTKANAVTLTARARAYLTSVFRERIECECPPGTISTGPEADVYDQTSGNETAGARILITPDWPKRWLKLENNIGDFRSMPERSHLPEVKRRWTATCSVDGVLSSYYDEETVLPDGSVFLDVAGSGTATIEDLLALDVPCLHYRSCSVTKAVGYTVTYDPLSGKCIPEPGPGPDADPLCGDSERDCFEAFSSEGIDWVDNVSGVPILDYPDSPTEIGRYKRYIDTWASPWWSFADHFESWPVQGIVPGYFDYWPKVGDVPLTNPALPPLKDRKSRTSYPSDPLMVMPLLAALFWRLYYGGFRLGVGNLKVDSATPPASKALTSASSPGWILTDCTAVFGASIVLTPVGTPTTIVATYELGRWGEAPYQYPRVCDLVRLAWSLTNVAEVRAYIVGVDGSERLLEFVSGDGFTTTGKDYSLYADEGTKYAGTWPQDHGVGFVTDVGADLDGDGISAATMADPERAASFNLLGAGQPHEIRIEIDPVDPAIAVTLEYPVFKACTRDKFVFWEGRQNCALVWNNGPGLRLGGQDYESGGVVVAPPAVRVPGSPMSVTDWMAWKRAYLAGTDPAAGVAADLATFYDALEGQTESQCANQCLAFLMPFRLGNVFYCGLVNGFDTPPLAHAPLKALNTRDWTRDGVRTLEIVQLAVEPRYGVTDGSTPMHWYDSSGALWTVVKPLPLTRWRVTQHTHAVTNDEALGKWTKGTRDMGSMRPWHGAMAVWKPQEVSDGQGVWNFVHPNGRYHELWVDGGNVFHGWSDSAVPWFGLDGQAQVTTGGLDSWPRGICDSFGDILVTFTRGTDSYLVTARNGGGSYETEVLLLTGVVQAVPAKNHLGGILFAGRRDADGVVVGCYQGPDETGPGADFVFVDQLGADIVIEDLGLCFVEPYDGVAAYVLVAVKSGGASQTRWVCRQTTGATWEEI